MPNTPFHLLDRIGDHGGAFGLSACSCGGGNGDQWRKARRLAQIRQGAFIFKIPDAVIVIRGEGNGFAAIHAAAAANGDDAIVISLMELCFACGDVGVLRVRRDPAIKPGGEPAF